MKINALNSMSVDELWSLHEQIGSVLSSKMSEEKARLEKRLDNSHRQPLPARQRGALIRRCFPSFVTHFGRWKLGQGAESSLAGFGLSCSTATRWKIFGYALPEGAANSGPSSVVHHLLEHLARRGAISSRLMLSLSAKKARMSRTKARATAGGSSMGLRGMRRI